MDDSKSLLEKLAKSAGSPPPLTVAGAFPPSMPPHSLASPMNPHSPHHMVMSSLPLPLGMPPFPTGRIPKSDPLEEKLQDMLRYNMEKYAGQHLDTLGMSRRVRELLSIHNIGQRLFAKYVLGLSQGTVSELLSKPKAWEKLTEKGRDSYRKMHAWCYDENAVMMLKSLIPRKSELSSSRAPPPPPPHPHPLPPRPHLFPPHSAPGPFPSGLLPPRPPLLKDIQQLKEKVGGEESLAHFMRMNEGSRFSPGGPHGPMGSHLGLGSPGLGHGLGLFPNLDKAMSAQKPLLEEPKTPKMPPMSPVEEDRPVSPPPSNIRTPEESMKDALQR